MLELDDGTQIGEAMAICRYFEALHPNPPLMGMDAKDAAVIEMWERRAYEDGLATYGEAVLPLLGGVEAIGTGTSTGQE